VTKIQSIIDVKDPGSKDKGKGKQKAVIVRDEEDDFGGEIMDIQTKSECLASPLPRPAPLKRKREPDDDGEVLLECSICFTDSSDSDFLVVGCTKAHAYCVDCLHRVVPLFCQGDAPAASCPGCKADRKLDDPDPYELRPDEVAACCEHHPEDMEKYTKRRLHSALQGMGDVIYCPAPGCDNAIVLPPKPVPVITIDEQDQEEPASTVTKRKKRRKRAPFNKPKKRRT